MVTPSDLALAGSIRRIYAESEIRLFEIIARRLARGIDSPGWAGAKASEILALRRDLERQIVELAMTGASTAADAVTGAYEAGEVAALTDLREAVRVSGAFGGGNPASIRALAAETVRAVSSTHVRILREATDIYRAVVSDATGTVLTGSATRRDAAQQVLNRFATQGITGFVDTAGRSWEAASYAEMAVRTSTMRAGVQGFADTLIANDSDLVIVSTSPRSCPRCGPWEGRVLSLSGRTPNYPTLDEAIGAGLHHPNCRHREHLYQPGVTRAAPRRPPEAERRALYEEEQRQRAIERQIRTWKRREAAALDEGAARAARVKVRAWQSAQREHLAGSDLPRRYDREQVTSAR